LEYIGESFKQAYYDYATERFYTNKNLTTEVEKRENIIYLDINTNQLYYWANDSYHIIESHLPHASETILGVLKLYDSKGNNVDGTMTQRAITEGLDNVEENVNIKIEDINKELDTKIELSLKEDEELVIFSL
jgi:hypothetical protein